MLRNLKISSSNSRLRLTLLILFFFSGISALVYQVVWFRFFHTVFGITVLAASTVLTAFMAGMAAGSLYFGRLADRLTHPLALFAVLEVGIGLYALCFPSIMGMVTSVYVGLPSVITLDFTALTLVQFALCVVVLFIPTALMGGTMPALAKALIKTVRYLSYDIGSLYSVNNLGAVAGAFWAGFLLLQQLGLRFSILIAATINIGIGLTSLWIWRQTPLAVGSDARMVSRPKFNRILANAGTIRVYPQNIVRVVLVVFAIEGFLSLGYEILWTRVLAATLMVNSVYSYSTIVITFILGLSLGGYIAAGFGDKCKDPVGLFGSVQVAIGIAAYLVLISFKQLPPLFTALPDFFSNSWAGIRIREFLATFVVMLVPTTLMGMTFPLAARIYTHSVKDLGRKIGDIGFLDIIGSIAGAFLTGFVLVSAYGLIHSLLMMITGNVIMGILVFLLNSKVPRTRRMISAPCTAGALLLALAYAPSDLTFTRSTSIPNSKVLYYKEDLAATVVVREFPDGRKRQKLLEIDGINVAGTPMTVLTTQKMQAHLPLLLHPDPKGVLTVGFGSGGSSWSIGRHPVERIECVEIVAALKESMRFFPETNHDVYKDPRLRILIQDGRNYMMMTRQKYDAVLNDSVHPIYQGNANLYTKEYFEFCKQKLETNGIMASWMPVWSLSKNDLKMMLKTFQTVFPHATLWYVPNNINKHLVVIGTSDKLKIDFKMMEAKFNRAEVRRDLAEIHMQDPYSILSCLLLDEEALKAFSEDALVNTENNPLLEFSAPRAWHLDRETWYANMVELVRYRKSVLPYIDLSGIDTAKWGNIKKTIERSETKTGWILKGILADIEGQNEKECNFFEKAFELDQKDANARQLLANSLYKMAVLHNDNKDYRKAISVSSRIRDLSPDFAPAYCSLGFAYFQTNQVDKAIQELRRAIELERDYGRPYYYLAVLLYGLGANPASVLSMLERAVELDPNLAPAYYNMAVLYLEQRMYSKAKRALERMMQIDPKVGEARSLLQKIKAAAE
ncbi:MAG: fused MFS/spermidine synthase [Desulfobacterales bacterium]|nr:MAG: fused MFS/spermidine synthase [Desulfobacterales bacterium]